MHVTWRLCGKCLASSCSGILGVWVLLGILLVLLRVLFQMSEAERPAQPTFGKGASLTFVPCVVEEVSRPCFPSY